MMKVSSATTGPAKKGKNKKNNPVVQVRLGEEFGQQCKRKKCQEEEGIRLKGPSVSDPALFLLNEQLS